MPGALFPGDFECQDYGGLIGLIVGISFVLACLVGGATFLTRNARAAGTGQTQRQEQAEQQFRAYQEYTPPPMQQPLSPPMPPPPAYPGPPAPAPEDPPAWAPGDMRSSSV